MSPTRSRSAIAAATLACLAAPLAAASIDDLTGWTLVEDPPDPGFSATVEGPASVLLEAADTEVPSGTDIGYQSVDGQDVEASTAGFAFDPAQSFSIAIDYAITFGGTPVGGLGIGLGIGEDRDGANSAGVALLTQDGGTVAVGGAARIDDVTQPLLPIFTLAQRSGSFFVTYDAASGNVAVGVGPAGANVPSATRTFTAIQPQWPGEFLFPAFFLRSDDELGAPWTQGTAEARFSNLRVLAGAPIEIQPPCPGDADGNGVVDLADLNTVLGAWGDGGPTGDLDGSGVVDVADLNLVLGAFGSAC